jgi:hypothetical protein
MKNAIIVIRLNLNNRPQQRILAMTKPTLFVDIRSQTANNPIEMALRAVAFGADPVEQLVIGDTEADIAITNSVDVALRMIKETESTNIVLAHFRQNERAVAEAFAGRNQKRVTAVPLIAFNGELGIVPFLLNLISKKTKEA